ncbi:MAG TPA: 4-(cytidine 5'-diphospho)-2-C-methyl-D-erythritol kinase [Bacteroidia bacterium]|jgi:4-diphosphocytidyl-2-C-methyl-D-erythritol kinase|nr:4-(cytidine 5'-diphospho)-2-C-methyl-D-erythritol kinase [Bacteroidia bacterium]
MITFPNAKINIGLNIIEKRPDQFHNLESVFYPIQLKDALEVIENKSKGVTGIQFTSSGISIPGTNEDNLCCKAYHLIRADYFMPPVTVHLLKNIPIGAGLGGGSADAAFFIKLLNDAFELGISWGELHHYARQLGSDCSFFISNKPVFAEEKGDTYEPVNLDLSSYFIALVYPNIHVNTSTAYSMVKPTKPSRSLEEDILTLPIDKWKHYIQNDFETSVFAAHPYIKTVKEQLYAKGAVYAAMSGSGSSVYGLFREPTNLKSEFKNMFVWENKML